MTRMRLWLSKERMGYNYLDITSEFDCHIQGGYLKLNFTTYRWADTFTGKTECRSAI
jgi:hypothetical protein